jgi:hypothetical protein
MEKNSLCYTLGLPARRLHDFRMFFSLEDGLAKDINAPGKFTLS